MSKKFLVLPILLTLALAVGCSQQRANGPDAKDAVNNALTANQLGAINVSVDRDKGVVTLKGDVQSDDEKARAQQVAQGAAPGLVIANEIAVRPNGTAGDIAKKVDSNTDDAIEDNMKAAIAAHQWENQHISFDAKNGVLKLTGDVDTASERTQVQKVAKNIPGVKQVVNELEVKGMKESAAKRSR